MLTRRDFIFNTISLGALVSFSPTRAFSLDPKFSLDKLNDQIFERIKQLSNGNHITLKILHPEGSLANIKPVADEFKKRTHINLEFTQTGVDDINTKLFLSAAAEDYIYDIALPATFGIPDLVEAGVLTNLDNYAQKYEPENFQSQSLYSVGDYYKSNLYGYQTDGDAYVMFYNHPWLKNLDYRKKYSDTFGIELNIPQTWVELDRVMKFFHQPEKNMFGGCLFRTSNYIPWEWWIRFHSKGSYPVTDELEAQINNNAGVEALEELIKASEHQHPGAKVNGLFDNWKVYAEGNCFANIGWGGSQKYFNSNKSKIKGKLAYAPTPGGYVNGELLKTPYFNWGWNYVVPQHSKNKELAYLFCLFACSPSASTKAVRQEGGFFDPFRPEHYKDDTIEATYSREFLTAHQQSMKECIPDFYLTGQGEYFKSLKENLHLSLIKKLTPKQALDLTAKEWERTTEKIGRDNQKEQWKFLKSRYPKTIQKFLK